MKLFNKYDLNGIELQNRIVMAPMTRSRAINNIPNELMAEYYKQRASAGLLITEGVSPSPNGLGYARIPGLFNDEQVNGWKLVTDAVHNEGGKIFAQLMHTGRTSHPENMPEGAKILSASNVAVSGEMYTDSKGMQPHPAPKEMSLDEIESTQDEYVQAALNAIDAGFDGVEIHGANGYLIDQFNNTASNKRSDQYGGNFKNRSRFALEVAKKISDAIGSNKTGIRLSPYGVFNDMEIFDEMDQQFLYLAEELGKLNLAYLHTVNHSSLGAPEVPAELLLKMKNLFSGTYIISGGFDKESAEKALVEERGDLVSFGRAFISNPDFVTRLEKDIDLNQPNPDTFYTPGAEGYTDYKTAV